jgi:hypothetical protein
MEERRREIFEVPLAAEGAHVEVVARNRNEAELGEEGTKGGVEGGRATERAIDAPDRFRWGL